MNFTGKEKVKHALVIGLVVLVLNMRPALFGNTFNELFILVPLAGLVFVYVTFGYRVVVPKSKRGLLGFTFAFILWIVSQIIVMDFKNSYIALVLFVTIPTVVLAYTVLISDNDVELVLKTIVVVVALLSFSQFVSYGLKFLGFEVLIAELYPVEEYASLPLKWYFPLTFTYHSVPIAGHQIERSVGIFREPGLYQLFINISYFALDFIRIKRKRYLRGLFILSLLMTFSTAGYAIFLVCLAYRTALVQRRKRFRRFVLLLAIVGFLWIFFNIPFFGLSDKMARNPTRMMGIVDSWALFVQQPLWGCGITVQHLSVFESGMGGVNLMTSFYKLGLVGFLLYLGLMTYALRKHYTAKTLVLWLPVFATMLVAQPMYEKAFTMLMLFLPTRNLASGLEGRKTFIKRK